MGKIKFNFLFFLIILSLSTFILFWQVFLQNKIPFSANLLTSFFNPWAQEKFSGWETGIPNRPTGKDDLWIFYPQRTFTDGLLKKREIPFWNPYSFSGNYHLGLSETAVFYPLNFLFLIFPQINVWVFLILIEPVIAGAGMFLFLGKIVVSKKSAIFGAFALAFSGILIVRSVEGLSVGHTLIWMPYVFWGIESFFQTKKIRYLCIILFSLMFSLLAGWLQYTFYIFGFSLIYLLFKIYLENKNKSKFYYLALIPFVILPFVTLFHIIPSFHALLDSPRVGLSGRVFSFQHLMPISHIFTLIIPDFWGNPAAYNYFGKSDYKESVMFIGIIPFIFSLFAILTRNNKKIIFFIISILITLILAVDNFISRGVISSNIPILTSFLPNRIFLITTFSFCVLAAYGFDLLINEKKDFVRKIIKKSFIFLWLIMVILGSFLAYRILKDLSLLNKVDKAGINISVEAIQFKNFIIPMVFLLATTITFFIFRNRYSKNIFFFLVIAVLFTQSFLFGQKYIPFSNREFLYPQHPVFSYLKENQGLDRFMSIGYGHIVPSIPLQFNLYSPEGIGSMYIGRYGEFISYMEYGDIKIPGKIAFDLEVYPKDVFYPNNNRLHRFYELISVKYIVTDKKSMELTGAVPNKNDFSLLWQNDKWQIYQYKKSMPRFFVTSNFQIIENDKEILKSLFSENFHPDKIVLEENPGFKPKENTGSAEIIQYSPNTISVKVKANNPSLFYLSDNYSKMFKVFIDGKEGKILRANYTFRAIPIPKGEHVIVMVYDNASFLLGLKIAIVVLLLSGILIFVYRKHI
ncbi:MAG: YfhO family protein [Candidatus Levybacteria bacterium]|nr:YfhO family protein [Candidatus Levybacteria bacterium]